MKNLTLRIQITLSEDPVFPIASSAVDRIVEKDIRRSHDPEDLLEIIKREIDCGVAQAKTALLSELKIPLNVDSETLRTEILSDLKDLIPEWELSGSFLKGTFRIHSIMERVPAGITRLPVQDISHPLDGSYLTTKYENLRAKLEDGTWTYVYQAGDYYEGIVERIDAPFNEGLLEAYFRNRGVAWEIPLRSLCPLPEPRTNSDSEE